MDREIPRHDDLVGVCGVPDLAGDESASTWSSVSNAQLGEGKQLVKYAKTLYENQPSWLKEAFPLSKPLPELSLEFAHGGKIVGVTLGAIFLMRPHFFLMRVSATTQRLRLRKARSS
jgi:hypothetical protein